MDKEQIAADDNVTLSVELAYNGASYSGFAKQKDGDIRTVQGELEHALSVLFRHAVDTTCAGRTDAGVHARAQVVSFEVPQGEMEGKDLGKMKISLNALTSDCVSVRQVRMEERGFSARFDAVRREYRYRIVTGMTPPVFLRDFSWWHRGDLDAESMNAAAQHLVGEHDFRSFCKAASAQGKSTMRCVESIDVYPEEQMGEACLCVRVVGNAFLHSMVRTIVGTLVQVGCGRRSPEWVAQVLDARDRNAAGETAPAAGLVFWNVDYARDQR